MVSYANNSCPAPFLSPDLFPSTGGYIDGRFCSAMSGTDCCLPCPAVQWLHPLQLNTVNRALDSMSFFWTILCFLLLLSWICLPVERTYRHYLSINLAIAIILLNFGFIIPLLNNPTQCINAITPHSMTSSPVCAFSGGFLYFGAFTTIMWLFMRSLTLHLQICWHITVGRRFMWYSHLAGWGIAALAFIVSFSFTGVSYRFGPTCHLNRPNSLGTFWVPLLLVANTTLIVTFVTFGYCVRVYLRSRAVNVNSTTTSSYLPGSQRSVRTTITTYEAYEQVRRVVSLQWRGIALVLIVVSNFILYCVLFITEDNNLEKVLQDPKLGEAWLFCLLLNPDDRTACYPEAGKLFVNEATVDATLTLLSLVGFWLLLFLGRTSMLIGWWELIRDRLRRRRMDFVPVDAAYDNSEQQRSREPESRLSGGKVFPSSPSSTPDIDGKSGFPPGSDGAIELTTHNHSGALSPLRSNPGVKAIGQTYSSKVWPLDATTMISTTASDRSGRHGHETAFSSRPFSHNGFSSPRYDRPDRSSGVVSYQVTDPGLSPVLQNGYDRAAASTHLVSSVRHSLPLPRPQPSAESLDSLTLPRQSPLSAV